MSIIAMLRRVWALRTGRRASKERKPKRRRYWLNLEVLEDRFAPAAVIWTDRPDYVPQSIATIFGSGFQPGETVQLQVLHTTGNAACFANNAPWQVTDGSNGGFQTTWFVANDCLGATLQVTATGLTLGESAHTMFTDGPGTTTTVTSSANTSVFGQSVTFTATVTGTSFDDGGAVTFEDGGVPLSNGTIPLNSGGTATFTISSLSVTGSPHTISAEYGGDANFSGSSGILSGGQTVYQAATTTTVTSSVNPSLFGQSVTFTATVTPLSGTFDNGGTVTFYDDGSTLGAQVLSGTNTAMFTTSSLSVGLQPIAVSYSGDTNFIGSTSMLTGGQTVNQATTTTVTSSAADVVFNRSVTLTATVSADTGTPSGVVTFLNAGTALGTGASPAAALPLC